MDKMTPEEDSGVLGGVLCMKFGFIIKFKTFQPVFFSAFITIKSFQCFPYGLTCSFKTHSLPISKVFQSRDFKCNFKKVSALIDISALIKKKQIKWLSSIGGNAAFLQVK